MMKHFPNIFEFIARRKTAYQLTFEKHQPANQEVLADLAQFCRAAETTLVSGADNRLDTERSLVLQGRREVWIRLQNHLNLSPADLYRLAGAPYDKRTQE